MVGVVMFNVVSGKAVEFELAFDVGAADVVF